MNDKPFSAEPVLSRLKTFQLNTVNYTYRRMYEDPVPTRRFLVADEVGLGKTQVARGLIARVVEARASRNERMDIIYICSNAAIATQNLDRLRIEDTKPAIRADRLTLLPLAFGGNGEGDFDETGVNFISFTPGTSFQTVRRGGKASERTLIHRMLSEHLDLHPKGLAWVLRGKLRKNWLDRFDHVEGVDTPHEGIAAAFAMAVEAHPNFAELEEVCDRFSRLRRDELDDVQREQASALTSWLRKTLAHCCLQALKPGLVILDEFQRFSELLTPLSATVGADGKAPRADQASAAALARELFNHREQPRVLMLSATPYKMLSGQLDKEDHYKDFIATANFLFDDPAKLKSLEDDLAAFRRTLVGVGTAVEQGPLLKDRVQATLKQVMCRTERISFTRGRDAMVTDVAMPLPLDARDLLDYACVDALAREAEVPDVMEYWRSSPYLLNFMRYDGYHFKRRVLEKDPAAMAAILAEHPRYRRLERKRIADYKTVELANPRLALLAQDIERNQAWRLLWVPPSLPYWPGEGAFADSAGFTKTLVFSSWNMVPDAVAGLLSYRAEQLAVEATPKTSPTRFAYGKITDQLASRLNFTGGKSGHDEMNALALMFPSKVLRRVVDPLALASGGGGVMTLAEARSITRERLERKIASLPSPDRLLAGPPDVRWYWLTLLLLERSSLGARVPTWCRQQWVIGADPMPEADPDEDMDDSHVEPAGSSGRVAGSGFAGHVDYWCEVWTEGLAHSSLSTLGPKPDDIVDVLVDLALAGPAVCAYRSLTRLLPDASHNERRSAAVTIADSVRRQLDTPEAIAIIRDDAEGVYWRRALRYCADGNLQALLDEYLHLLHEEKRPNLKEGLTHGKAIAAHVAEAGHIRAGSIRPDEVSIENGRLEEVGQLGLRCRYAMRYGNATEDDKVVARKEALQKAFNSPFRPFVLASTSVGQEGLDFHSWCHSIVHWNLPGNPVDMEQREGRVHRYKGLAVRRNVAQLAGFKPVAGTPDPWKNLFASAAASQEQETGGLVPYWICEVPGGATVQRRVFMYPFSQDARRFARLKSSLVLYRMVFAQPRQQDLLEHLLVKQGEGEDVQALVDRWQISLLPEVVCGGQDVPEGD